MHYLTIFSAHLATGRSSGIRISAIDILGFFFYISSLNIRFDIGKKMTLMEKEREKNEENEIGDKDMHKTDT